MAKYYAAEAAIRAATDAVHLHGANGCTTDYPVGRDLRDATVRVVFTTPVDSPDGPLYATRTKGTFNCTTRRLAVKENTFYGNAKETKVVEHKVNKIPGFGWVPEGSLGAVAIDYLCKP